MIENTDIIVERDDPCICITFDQGQLRLTPKAAREIAADLDRIAIQMAREVLE